VPGRPFTARSIGLAARFHWPSIAAEAVHWPASDRASANRIDSHNWRAYRWPIKKSLPLAINREQYLRPKKNKEIKLGPMLPDRLNEILLKPVSR